jgi:hypothetical protein
MLFLPFLLLHPFFLTCVHGVWGELKHHMPIVALETFGVSVSFPFSQDSSKTHRPFEKQNMA